MGSAGKESETVSPRLLAASQALLMLWLAGCSTAGSPRPPQSARVTVAAPPGLGAEGQPAAPPKEPTVVTLNPARRDTAPEPASPAGGPTVAAAPQPASPSAPVPVPAAPAPPVEPQRATPAPPRSAPRLVAFNFDNADVELVVQAASDLLGFNYVLAGGARGRKVTVQTAGRIPIDEIFPVLLTILDVNGLAAVRSGSIYRIIPKEGAPQTSIRTVVGRQLDARIPGDEVITQVIPLQFVNATEAVVLLRPFIPQQGTLAAHRETNLLVVTDSAANVRRILDILKLVDIEVALDELKLIPVKHADAAELAQLLNQLFATGRISAGTGLGLPGTLPAVPGAAAQGAVRRPAPGEETGALERPPLIVPERRSNSLVVHARKQEMETIRRLVEKLDVDIYGGQQVFIYFAENAKAKELAATLDAIYSRERGLAGSQPSRGQPGGGPGLPAFPAPLSAPTTSTPAARPAGFPGLSGEGGPPTTELRFIADEVTNAIIVTTYPRLWKEIEETIKKLDKMPRQVLIEVLAAEVTLSDDTKLGIEWAVRSGRFDVSSSPSGTLPSRPPTSIIPFGGIVPPGLNFFTFATEKFLAALNALATENKVNVLSSPSIMTTENKKAVINVSTSVPVVTAQQVPVSAGGSTGNSITQSVEYRDAGIILTVTPRIGEQGTVALDVKQEVNEVGSAEPPPINSPRFTKREAETSVVLLNNQTLVLGGLIQNKRTKIRTGIPFLNRIPVLGYLFGSIEDKIEKTELLLLITPRVVGTAVEAGRITEQMRHITPEIYESIKQAPHPLAPTPTPRP